MKGPLEPSSKGAIRRPPQVQGEDPRTGVRTNSREFSRPGPAPKKGGLFGCRGAAGAEQNKISAAGVTPPHSPATSGRFCRRTARRPTVRTRRASTARRCRRRHRSSRTRAPRARRRSMRTRAPVRRHHRRRPPCDRDAEPAARRPPRQRRAGCAPRRGWSRSRRRASPP